jgi:hypothetical protein
MLRTNRIRARRRALSAAAVLLALSVSGCASPPRPDLLRRDLLRRAPSGTRADAFMHSVEIRDGALGWRQLCPDVQAQVSQEALRSQADAQKAAETGKVRRLRFDFVGSRAVGSTGQVRFYLVTAEFSDGSEAFRTYVLRTQADGCVHDVQTAPVQ